jgi:hypothetical protein
MFKQTYIISDENGKVVAELKCCFESEFGATILNPKKQVKPEPEPDPKKKRWWF